MNKFGFALGAAALLVVTTISAAPSSQANGCIFANFGGGTGTIGDPLLVASAEHLTELKNDSRCWAYVLKQTVDISMGGVTWSAGIGGTYPGTFAGTYDGDGHTISSLTIDTPGGAYVGLFTQVSVAGVIRNLSFDGNVTAEAYVGGLVGNNQGLIENSFVGSNGLITATSSGVFPGGLVGLNDSTGTIRDSYSAATVVSPIYGAGLIGSNSGGTVTNSYAVGAVTGSFNKGLIATGTGAVTNSFWDTESSGALTSAAGTGKTTGEMKTPSTFATWSITQGWSTGTPWGICPSVNSGYPFLTVFYTSNPCAGAPENSAPSAQKYSFSFNTSNGGECFPEITVTQGQRFTLPDQSVACTPEGTRLIGWSVPNQSGGNFSAGGTVAVSGSQTFTAVAENRNIAVVYDPNVGYSSPGSTELVPCFTSDGVNIHTAVNSTWVTDSVKRVGNLAAMPACVPRGLTFSGWSNQGSPNGQVLPPGSAVPISWSAAPNPVNSIQLYAVWSYS